VCIAEGIQTVNFRHLEVFYAVMINGTVTAAARQLGVSQPSVTTTLKQAEAKLGVQLFHRESGRLTPTDEARLLFEEAERAHEALATLNILAKGLELGRGGHVRVAATPTLSLELLPDAIARFEERHTGFQYSVATLNTEEIVAELDTRKGRFDLGFTFGAQSDSGLASSRIGEAGVFAAFPADWHMVGDGELDLGEVRDRRYIAGFDQTALGIESGKVFAKAGVEPNVVARSHTHQVAGALVQRGLGFAFLDSLTIHALLEGPGRGSIVLREVRGVTALPVVAVYPGQRRLSNAAAIFIECFQQAFDRLETRVRAYGGETEESIQA
jgi:DNA-binding transcriptional LysR family regulator